MTRRAWTGALALVLWAAAAPVAAQDAGSLERVDSLIAEGRTDAARTALTDWLASNTTPSRTDAQRAIWQRALLTVDPAQAALDYQRLVVEYPGGRYSDRALLRLAQAAQAQGDPARARALIASLLRDYPSSPARLEASTLLEGLPAGPERAAAVASTAAPAATDSRTSGLIEERPAESDVPAPSVRDPVPTPRTVVLAPEPEEKPAPKAGAKSSARAPAKTAAKAPARAAEAPEKTPAQASAKPASEPPAARAPDTSIAKPAEKPAAKSADPGATGRWTVQVGAFASPERAQALVRELVGSGLAARLVLVPGSRLIRVRTGRFVTQADAERERDRLAARDLPATVAADADREEAAP